LGGGKKGPPTWIRTGCREEGGVTGLSLRRWLNYVGAGKVAAGTLSHIFFTPCRGVFCQKGRASRPFHRCFDGRGKHWKDMRRKREGGNQFRNRKMTFS